MKVSPRRLDRADSAKLVVTRFGRLIYDVLYGQCAVMENAETLDRVRKWDCDIINLKGIDGNGEHFQFCSDEHYFCLFTIQLKFILRQCSLQSPNKSQMWFSAECGRFRERRC